MDGRLAFNAFLSHRYRSSDVNLFFWGLMSEVADVQFEVDVGTFATSTTRLARLIRDADAFVGIYPLDLGADEPAGPDVLREQSRYFRLELDMAVRARKPAVVFFDRRYLNVFATPPDVIRCDYRVQEVTSSGGSPSWNRLQAHFRRFVDAVAASRQQPPELAEAVETGLVGVLAPPDSFPRDAMCDVLGELSLKPLVLRWPPRLDLAFVTDLRRCDWVLVEDASPPAQAVLAFLQGQAIPHLRTRHAASEPPPTEDVLFGGFEVGYSRDVLAWDDPSQLAEDLRARVGVIMLERSRRISDAAAASSYFQEAALRKEAVFLSYARPDAEVAQQLSRALKRRFQNVFDYGDREALPQGQPWLDSLLDKLASAAVGVAVMSRHYLESNYCKEEARRLAEASVTERMRLYTVKADDSSPPNELTSLQYFRLTQWSPDEIVAKIVADLGAPGG